MTIETSQIDNHTSTEPGMSEADVFFDIEDKAIGFDEKFEETEAVSQRAESTTASQDQIHSLHTSLLQASILASRYSFTPKVAITTANSGVNSIQLSKNYNYLFLGGDDGFLRKYNFVKSLKGDTPLTIQQKHFVVDGIYNNGFIVSYTPNEILQPASKIKSASVNNSEEYYPLKSKVLGMDIQSECHFGLLGQENGDVLLQGVRYKEGKIYHVFKEDDNKGMNNFIKLNNDEDQFFAAGYFDKRLRLYDLNNGKLKSNTTIGDSQLSNVEFRSIHGSSIFPKDHDESDIDMLFEDDDDNDDDDDEKELNEGDKKIYDDYINPKSFKTKFDENILLTSQLNGKTNIFDLRVSNTSDFGNPAVSLLKADETPPWALNSSWSFSGDKVFVGRRNASVEQFDIRNPSKPERLIKFPKKSGEVTCVRTLPNDNKIICASIDNIRVYDLENDKFNILPGHHGGYISNLYLDPTARFLITTSGNKGVISNSGVSTDLSFVYTIDNY
ncbi:hypothetical protein QEN19_003799 [Hanseniaspora menglaensis]